MRFSTKRGDASDVDSNLTYLRGFKTGNTTVRFLQEMEEWDKYREHYTLDGKMFPCIKTEGTCPGCTSNNEKVSKSSRKYATNVFLVDTGQVLPFKIPITLAKLLENRADRNGGTLLNRDYVVMRSGSGMDTSYDVDTDEKYVIDVAEKLKDASDIGAILEAAFVEQWGDPEEFVEQAEAPKPSRSNGFTLEEVASEPRKKAEDIPPTETSSQSESADDEVINEDDLYKMERNDLETVAMKVGVAYEGMTDRQLIRKILATA